MQSSAVRFLLFISFFCFTLLLNPPIISAQTYDNQILFYDSFNSSLDKWRIKYGDWHIDQSTLSNKWYNAIDKPSRIEAGDQNWENYRLEVDLMNFDGIDSGIGFRRNNATNSDYELTIRHGNGEHGSGETSTPQVVLQKVYWNQPYVSIQSSKILGDNRSFQLLHNQWYHIKIEVFNNNIKVWINDNKLFDFTDDDNDVKSGFFTLATWTGKQARINVAFDNVKVTELGPEPFLDLPWNYEGKGFNFNDAALSINSFFDHQYPLLSAGLSEPVIMRTNFINFSGQALEESDTQWYSSHDGYDYGLKAKVRWKDPVLAASDGKATYIDPNKSSAEGRCTPCGNMIIIDHKNGYQTRYLHLDDNDLIISEHNQTVEVSQGQQIGKVGFTGNVKPNNENGAHIHFGVFQDKNRDGNFNDNIPDGVTDPFGWQSDTPDPWPNYTFNYLGQNRMGNKSYYLWKNKLTSMISTTTPESSTTMNVGNYTLNFPQGSSNQNIVINAKSAPIATSNNLVSVGSTLFIKATDLSGNPVINLPNQYTLKFDFSTLDISKLKADTLSFYSSPDGNIWTKEDTNFPTQTLAQTQLNHFSYFALMGERRDTTPPITIAILSGTEGQPNWFRSDVNLTLEAQDDDLGVYYTAYRIGEGEWKIYDSPIKFTDEGNYKVEFYSVDEDENTEELKSVEFNIDKTSPTITGSFTPEPNFLGWNNTDVTVHFVCSDNLKIASCPDDYIVSTEGEGQSVTGTVFDKAGNSASYTVTPINIDKTAPEISLNLNPLKLWPPNGKMINITVGGYVTEKNEWNIIFNLTDEYGLGQPPVTYFGQTIQLKASRYEEDKNGRTYTLEATASDVAGNTTISSTQILVPHDQRK